MHLLRPSAIGKLSVCRLLFQLKPAFSEEGFNALSCGKALYTKFIKYIREVSSGQRVVTLENILEFTTGASEELPLDLQSTATALRELKQTECYNTIRLTNHKPILQQKVLVVKSEPNATL